MKKMRMRSARMFCLLAVLALAVSAVAQEGHPLTGTWYGDFGSTPEKRMDLTVILSWDGKATSGIVNPGPNAIPVKVAVLDAPKWEVHFEVDQKNKSGAMDHFVFDGKLLNPVAGNRRIRGTWTCGSQKGDFTIQRD